MPHRTLPPEEAHSCHDISFGRLYPVRSRLLKPCPRYMPRYDIPGISTLSDVFRVAVLETHNNPSPTPSPCGDGLECCLWLSRQYCRHRSYLFLETPDGSIHSPCEGCRLLEYAGHTPCRWPNLIFRWQMRK